MEREKQSGNNRIVKEFYYIDSPDGNRSLVSAIGKNGGYVYFLIKPKGDIRHKSTFHPIISQITDIMPYCESPETRVTAIEPKGLHNKNLCDVLSASIDSFLESTTNENNLQ